MSTTFIETLAGFTCPFPDSRDPDFSRKGIFQTHNCYRCKHGALPCKQGHPNRCDNLIARND